MAEEERVEEEENAAKFADGNKDGFSARSRKRLAGDACSTKDRERVSRRLARGVEPERDQTYLTSRGGGVSAGKSERAREEDGQVQGDDVGQRKGDECAGTDGGC